MLPIALLQQTRRIFLRDYEIMMSIGVHEFEKVARQRVLINVDLYVNLAQTNAQDDALSAVLDYDFVRMTVQEVIEKRHIQLQETLCDVLLDLLCAPDSVVAARVSTMKPDVYPDCAGVGIEVYRCKPVASRELA